MKQFKPVNKVVLPVDLVYKRLGARLGRAGRLNTEIESGLKTRVEDIINLSEKIFTPRTVVSYGNVTVKDSAVAFDTGFIIRSKTVADLFKNAFKGYGFLVTVGEGISLKTAECLNEKNVFDALVFDACGSVAVELMAEYTYNAVSEMEICAGNAVTKRFSPGYPDWDVSGQEYFLHWLGAQNIDVWLTDSFQMMPEKSISAVFGVYK